MWWKRCRVRVGVECFEVDVSGDSSFGQVGGLNVRMNEGVLPARVDMTPGRTFRPLRHRIEYTGSESGLRQRFSRRQHE